MGKDLHIFHHLLPGQTTLGTWLRLAILHQTAPYFSTGCWPRTDLASPIGLAPMFSPTVSASAAIPVESPRRTGHSMISPPITPRSAPEPFRTSTNLPGFIIISTRSIGSILPLPLPLTLLHQFLTLSPARDTSRKVRTWPAVSPTTISGSRM